MALLFALDCIDQNFERDQGKVSGGPNKELKYFCINIKNIGHIHLFLPPNLAYFLQ